MKDLDMRFDVPNIEHDMNLLAAHPFKVVMKTQNSTYVVKYTGPNNILVSAKTRCTYASNL
jgi:hypothetical protein